MREVQASEITRAVKDLFIDANCNLGEDVLAAFDRGIATDESPVAKEVLRELKENARIAEKGSVYDPAVLTTFEGFSRHMKQRLPDIYKSSSSIINMVKDDECHVT